MPTFAIYLVCDRCKRNVRVDVEENLFPTFFVVGCSTCNEFVRFPGPESWGQIRYSYPDMNQTPIVPLLRAAVSCSWE